eukprot:5113262-Alexandrium_andersonii.AAC.1
MPADPCRQAGASWARWLHRPRPGQASSGIGGGRTQPHPGIGRSRHPPGLARQPPRAGGEVRRGPGHPVGRRLGPQARGHSGEPRPGQGSACRTGGCARGALDRRQAPGRCSPGAGPRIVGR